MINVQNKWIMWFQWWLDMNDLKPMHTWMTLNLVNESDCAQPNDTWLHN
jgi:hypothetical protein